MTRYDAYVIPDFRPGKQLSRRPGFEPEPPRTVVAIPPSRARRFFRARSDAELRAHLRRLRDEGKLLTSNGRGLRHNMRFEGRDGPTREPWYVVEAPNAEAVPRVR